MQRGHDSSGSTRSRRYPCSAKCVISPNFKHGCFEKVCASHLNVSPDITFIQFASQLRASMVSSHIRTPTAANRSCWDSQHQSVAPQMPNSQSFFPRHELLATRKHQDISQWASVWKKCVLFCWSWANHHSWNRVDHVKRYRCWSHVCTGTAGDHLLWKVWWALRRKKKKKRDSDKNWILLELLN